MSFLISTKEQLQQVVNESKSFREVLRKFNMENTSGNYRALRKRIREDNIDLSNINSVKVLNGNKDRFMTQRTNEELFTENNTAYTETVKRRVIKEKLIPYECQICKTNDIWQNKKLTLILDHINGISNDHRLTNLRFLCPNCNSQTDTFCGRNNLKLKHKCPKCGKPFQGIGSECKQCHYDSSAFRIDKETLSSFLTKFKTYNEVGRQLKISSMTVAKYCRMYDLKRPLV